MIIETIELVKYKRFLLNNVDTFKMSMEEVIQLIIGTNGSGKSSLLHELSPLPAEASHYAKDGSKTITITYQGNNYLLTSSFPSMGKANHSFIKNKEELNPGGTQTVQKELVKQEFNYTPQIHELKLGIEKFTSMSPSKKREWFTLLSPTNYDYAIELYNKLKQICTEKTTILKHTKKRLIAEIALTISPAEEEKIKAEMELIEKELNMLIGQSSRIEKPVHEYQREQDLILQELNRLSDKLLRIKFLAPYGIYPYGINSTTPPVRDEWYELRQPGFESIEDIDNFLGTVKHNITVKETILNQKVSEHNKLNETVSILMRTGEEGINALQNKISHHENCKEELSHRKRLGMSIVSDPNSVLSALDSVQEMLNSIFTTIPNNEDRKYSSNRLIFLKTSLSSYKDKELELQKEYNNLIAKKIHAENHKANGNTTCPKCKHQWIEGYSDEQYSKLLKVIADKEKEITDLGTQLKLSQTEIDSIEEYAAIYRSYVRCVNGWPILSPLWDYIQDGNYVFNSPKKVIAILDLFHHDLNIDLEIKHHEKEIKDISDLIQSAKQVGNANLMESKTKLAECDIDISNLTIELSGYQKVLADYSAYRRQLIDAIELGDKIGGLMKQADRITEDMVETLRRETIMHCIRQFQHSLARKSETINNINQQKAIIADLQAQIEKFSVEEAACKELLKHLSPTDGLIAKGLLGFIRQYVGQMNSLIRKVWTYPLIMKDCGTIEENSTELDYIFPLIVQSEDNVVSDIKYGSSGMKEIIDLVFMVVALDCLGMSDHTLMLDEFGIKLDEEHRLAATSIIKSIMEQYSFSQLYMISHYESTYGAFNNAEITVMCSNNILVPESAKFNQQVFIS